MARPHHYNFAHVALRDLSFVDPAELLKVLSGEGAHEYLLRLWNNVHEFNPEGERIPPEGLKSAIYSFPDRSAIAIITLPTPEVMTEAGMVAIAFTPNKAKLVFFPQAPSIRYLTLELTEDHDGKETYLLCEWAPSDLGWYHGNFDEPLEKQTETQLAKRVREVVKTGAEPSVSLAVAPQQPKQPD
jgi:hypothetical protein